MTANLGRRVATISILCLWLNQSMSAQVTACHDFTDVDVVMTQVVGAAAPSGASLSIARQGQLLFERAYGGFDMTTVVPIASAICPLSASPQFHYLTPCGYRQTTPQS